MTEFQSKLVETLKSKYAINGHMCVAELAARNKTSRIAVWSAMKSLKTQGVAGFFRRGTDQWAAAIWFLNESEK